VNQRKSPEAFTFGLFNRHVENGAVSNGRAEVLSKTVNQRKGPEAFTSGLFNRHHPTPKTKR
jgi:hypothetical protein